MSEDEYVESTNRLSSANLLLITGVGKLNESSLKLFTSMNKLARKTVESTTISKILLRANNRHLIALNESIQSLGSFISLFINNLAVHMQNLIQSLAMVSGEERRIKGTLGGTAFEGTIAGKPNWMANITDMFRLSQEKWTKSLNTAAKIQGETNKQQVLWSETIRLAAREAIIDQTKIQPIADQLSKKQTEKGANAMVKMIGATMKASVYAYIMEQFMELWDSLMWSISYWGPLITVLAAMLKYAMAPAVIEMTLVFAQAGKELWKYRDALRWLFEAQRESRDYVYQLTRAYDELNDSTSFVNQVLTEWIRLLYGSSPGLIPGMQWLSDIVDDMLSPFYSFVGYFEDFKDLVEDFSFPSLDGGDGDGGDDDDDWFCDMFPWLCAQHGAYTGSYTGFMKVHPDEYIVPGDKMRAGIGSGRSEDIYYEQKLTNFYLEEIYIEGKKKRARFR